MSCLRGMRMSRSASRDRTAEGNARVRAVQGAASAGTAALRLAPQLARSQDARPLAHVDGMGALVSRVHASFVKASGGRVSTHDMMFLAGAVRELLLASVAARLRGLDDFADELLKRAEDYNAIGKQLSEREGHPPRARTKL